MRNFGKGSVMIRFVVRRLLADVWRKDFRGQGKSEKKGHQVGHDGGLD